MNDKNNFGYNSEKPCEICGKYKNNQLEPRFLYSVCEDHQNIAPNKMSDQVAKPEMGAHEISLGTSFAGENKCNLPR